MTTRECKRGREEGREETLRYNESKERRLETMNAARRVNEFVCVCVVCKCWIACAPGGLVYKRACEARFFTLFFILLLFAALCVCDGSPAETKGEQLYGCWC